MMRTLLCLVSLSALLFAAHPALAQEQRWVSGTLQGTFGDLFECRATNLADADATLILVLRSLQGAPIAGPTTPLVTPGAVATLTAPAVFLPNATAYCEVFAEVPVAGNLTVKRSGLYSRTEATSALRSSPPQSPALSFDRPEAISFTVSAGKVRCFSDSPYVGYFSASIGDNSFVRVQTPTNSGSISQGIPGPQYASHTFAGVAGTEFSASVETGSGGGLLSLITTADAIAGCEVVDP